VLREVYLEDYLLVWGKLHRLTPDRL
jgi:hypothetical protein